MESDFQGTPLTSVQAYVCVKKVLVLLLYPCLLGFNCDCNFKFRYCNQPFYINGLWLFKFGKIDYFGKCQCFWCVALIFVQLIFAYGLLKKKPNFILIWILGEAVNLVVRLHSILKCYCLTLISIINISLSNFSEQSLEKSHFTN